MVSDTVYVIKQDISLISPKTDVNLDSIRQEILLSMKRLGLTESDTLKYQCDIYDISSQGAEVNAYYLQGKIVLSQINIYGEMGQTKIVYEFADNQIKVTEKDYQYEVEFMLVTDKDIKLIKDFSYTMNMEGIPLEKVDSNRVDVFQEFRQVVPFILR
jgi:hypothetical protein